MYRAFPLTIAVTLLVGADPARSQEPDARAVVDKALQAHGGDGPISKLKARHNKVKGVIHLAGGISFTQEVYYQAPGQIKEITQAEVNGKKSTFVTVLNGDKGWIVVDGQAQEVDEKKLTEMKESAHLAQVSRLAGLGDKAAYQLAPLAAVQVEGRPALGVKVSAKGFRDIHLYFDKENSLLVKAEGKALDAATGQLVNQESLYRNHKEIEGIKTPTSLTVLRDGKKFMEADALEIKFLDKLDENIFAKP